VALSRWPRSSRAVGLRGEVELSEARRVELVEEYRGAVLTALADVEDALVAVRGTREREVQLEAAARRRAGVRAGRGAVPRRRHRPAATPRHAAHLFSTEDALGGIRWSALALVALYERWAAAGVPRADGRIPGRWRRVDRLPPASMG
jgi:hypothetical protein